MTEQTDNQVEHTQDGVQHTLRIVVATDDMAARVDAATRAYQSRARMPGFRAGKAPLSMIRQQFGKEIRQHVLDHTLPEVLSDELKSRELHPLDSPELADVQFEPGTALDFTVKFDTAPDVVAANLELTATRPAVEVTDEMIDEALGQLRERGGRLEQAEDDALAAEDMFARCQITILPKDGKGKTLAEENRFVRIGHEAAIPALNEELPGLAVGAKREFVTALGEQFPNALLAGSEVLCRIQVNELKVRTLPELDDDFAKEMGVESFATMRESVASEIGRDLERQADRAVENQLLEGLRNANPVDVPASLIERRLDEMSRRFANDLAQQGIDAREGIDWQAFRREQRGPATDSIAEELLLDQFAADHEMEVDDATVEEEIRIQVDRREGGKGRPVVSVIQQMRKDGSFDGLRITMRRRLALEHLREHATIDGDSGEKASDSGVSNE